MYTINTDQICFVEKSEILDLTYSALCKVFQNRLNDIALLGRQSCPILFRNPCIKLVNQKDAHLSSINRDITPLSLINDRFGSLGFPDAFKEFVNADLHFLMVSN